MKHPIYHLISSLFIGLAVFLFYSLIKDQMIFNELSLTGSFFILLLLTLYGMFYLETYAFSVNKMVMTFFMFFFVFAPVQQYNENIIFNNLPAITNEEILVINMLTIVFLIGYMCIYHLYKNKMKEITINIKKIIRPHTEIILLIISYAILFYFISEVGFYDLLSRQTSAISIPDQTIRLIIDNFVRMIPVPIAFYLMYFTHRRIRPKLYSLIPVLILIFPLGGSARFMIGFVYLMLFAPILFKKEFRHALIPLMIVGMLVIFPSVDFFRNNSISQIGEFSWSLKLFETMDFDAYFMSVQTLKYVTQEGFLYGQQLLGAIFTFIPRNVWEAKPVITGFVLVEALNGEFWNVSTGIIGEAYIDFGFLGVLLYGLIFGGMSVAFDYFLRRPYLLYAQGIAYIALGLVFFNLRGALLTTMGYTYGGLAAVTVVYVMIVLTRGIHNEVTYD